jgi:O6-methylguanine-DNA--protein-cysteine methyltransferase
MPRPTKSPPALTAAQARYILEKLIDEGTVSPADVRRHLAGMWQEMNFLEKRIAELRGVASTIHPVRRVKAAARRVRRAVSPALSKSLAMQGQYIGLLRQIPEGDRKHFQDLAKDKGREAAIAALKKRLRK